MAAKRASNQKAGKEEQEDNAQPFQPSPFWSGVISFGLVSLPVSLFPANRGRPLSLHMVDQDGMPLRRRYFCEKEHRVLENEDLVRGYPIEKDKFVIIHDEDLEAVAPEKSREIDLRRFVPLDDINPVYFERGYYLTPNSGATKPYRLLARSMAQKKRAGVATFVMRGKEYIIAIISEKGLLRAETLRFQDEIRSPADIGLPELEKADRKQVSQMTRAMKSLSTKTLDQDLLRDRETERIFKRIDKKLSAGEDVVQLPEEVEDTPEEEGQVVDLMQVLKQRLQGKDPGASSAEKRAQSKGRGSRKANGSEKKGSENRNSGQKTANKSRSGKSRQKELEALSRNELYQRAQDQSISGRSHMSKQELVDALQKAS
ncbi:Ku protein [Marinobacter nanhaiticus D15-8W]|uniref:Non-homologous end joining protein Ku n=1 Tax=Marinobacter nanhaiticus D15-8W TaxID=626887 RepID=N6VZG1_9GAMM|nr:Ku protein [Marinobacter nanhaiticus]ENO13259.1 Ku protein [Marinobacter nanhaiticus D15-8W]BES70623.1 Ku protein [Marinobacter nanhaiticus D15-8W]